MPVKISFGKNPEDKAAALYKAQRDALYSMLTSASHTAEKALAIIQQHNEEKKATGQHGPDAFNQLMQKLKAAGLPSTLRNPAACQVAIMLAKDAGLALKMAKP